MKHTVIDLASYRRSRDLTLVAEADLTEAVARIAFLMTPAPVVFWLLFWAEYASSQDACRTEEPA